MFSLDFSDTMMPHTPNEGMCSAIAQSPGGVSEAATGLEAIAAALQLFDLCSPAEDSTISANDLSRVLRSHLGGQAEAERILDMVTQDSDSTDNFNFLNYWQGMDRFFQEAGGLAHQHLAANAPGAGENVGTIKGMQRFRDGVLIMASSGNIVDKSTSSIPSVHLLNLLEQIRAVASDPIYWDEVIQAVPAEEGIGLTVPEVAEAVYIWLKDFLKSELDVAAGIDEEQPWPEAGEVATSPGTDPANARTRTSMNFGDGQFSVPLSSLTSINSNQRRPSMLDALGPKMSVEMRRVHEIQDLVMERTPQENVIVHQALKRLGIVHDSVFSSILSQQQDIDNLQREVASISEKKSALEDELARTQHYASELDTKIAVTQSQSEDSTPSRNRKVAGLEKQVKTLTAQNEELQRALAKTKAHHEDNTRELESAAQKTLRTSRSLDRLQDQADSAEGRAEWMMQRFEQMKRRYKVASQALCSYACCAEEGDEAAALLQQQLSANLSGNTADNGGLLQGQLQRLRQVRDDLLKAHESWAARTPNEGSSSPRETQVHRRCTFLAAQLAALLRHSTSLEVLFDKASGNGDAADKRLSSAQQFTEECNKNFNELSDQLHTLEVQKTDVDQELRRLQQKFEEQERKLREVQRNRDQLLVEAGNSPGGRDCGKKMDNSDSVSIGSSSPGDSAGFLFDGARPSSKNLQASPKQREVQAKVRAVVQMRQSLARPGIVESQSRRPNPLVFDIGNRRASALQTETVEAPRKHSRQPHRHQHSGDQRLTVAKGARREEKDTHHHQKTGKAKSRDKANCGQQ